MTSEVTFDDPRSRESEELAFKAEAAERCGNVDEAKQLFARAAALEEAVVDDVPQSSPRVKRVLAISAIALWLRAYEHLRASDLAVKYIAVGLVTEEDLIEIQRDDLPARRSSWGTRMSLCSGCDRPRPRKKLPAPSDAITHCEECNVAFTLAEIGALFNEANLLDSNAARGFRRGLVDDLISGLERLVKSHSLTSYEAFLQGFVAAKDPRSARDTLLLMPDAERAYEDWRRTKVTAP